MRGPSYAPPRAEHWTSNAWRCHGPRPTPRQPVVYFIGARDGCIKIGTTIKLVRRVAELQHMGPLPLWVFMWHTGGEAEEAAHHAALDAYRSHGEWFAPVPRVWAYLESVRVGINRSLWTEPGGAKTDWQWPPLHEIRPDARQEAA
jgi:hypothetical protein